MSPLAPRTFAIAVVVVSLSALFAPVGAVAPNECTNADPTDHVCLDQTVEVPNQLPTQVQQVVDLVEHRYYVYVNIADCARSVVGADCTGAGQGPGTVFGAFGTVYYESNGFGGLQRTQFVVVGRPAPVPADTMLLL